MAVYKCKSQVKSRKRALMASLMETCRDPGMSGKSKADDETMMPLNVLYLPAYEEGKDGRKFLRSLLSGSL